MDRHAMSIPADWADDAAAQIMVVAYTATNGRDLIAEILRLTYARGQEYELDKVNRMLIDIMKGEAA
jgi:hypothetical protein